jgi:hypothetical protein
MYLGCTMAGGTSRPKDFRRLHQLSGGALMPWTYTSMRISKTGQNQRGSGGQQHLVEGARGQDVDATAPRVATLRIASIFVNHCGLQPDAAGGAKVFARSWSNLEARRIGSRPMENLSGISGYVASTLVLHVSMRRCLFLGIFAQGRKRPLKRPEFNQFSSSCTQGRGLRLGRLGHGG